MSKIMYCARCEKMVVVDLPDCHTIYLIFDDVVVCDGPFYDSEPPTNNPDWDLQDEPSQEELVLMNLAAEELLQDLGV